MLSAHVYAAHVFRIFPITVNWPLKSHVAIGELFCEGVVVFVSFCASWLLLSVSEDTVRSTDSRSVVSQTVPFARREYS